jgi:uncharacterized damage-inducible protein DinB
VDVISVRELYGYHWWANRRLLGVAAALGETAVATPQGAHFSFPTLKGTFAHIYGADWIWFSRWKGGSPTALPGDADFPSLAALRARWDDLERDQRSFIESLGEADLARAVDYKNTQGKPFRLSLGQLLRHVVNHATHHRSEIATMLTAISGSPPATDMVVYQVMRSGQA